ncbi:MAG: tRNA (adenosine(37)-N6)-threonylcarbamoyltransferase complex ATPase subunit type 1 TsaE [Clostridia bacterium]|nr:tRNA (adenosine(37)-N6)-threonylcarbamoyltransferase complex ATPase subunit type 1 TsaE [Clostridia bacterium]
MIEIITNSAAETEAFAENFAKELVGGEVIAFKGSMGMGKTCFTRGLARGLGFTGQVTSPTFALVNEYIGGRLSLYHFDMYRIESWEDLYSSGFFDYKEAGGVIAAEWSENIEGALDYDTIVISFERLSDNSRKITVFKGEDK